MSDADTTSRVSPETTDNCSGGCQGHHKKDTICERGFERLGKSIVKRPWLSIGLTFLFAFAFMGGYALLKDEARPERLWVPSNAKALIHKDYVDETWAQTTRFEFFIAKCKAENCNILEPKYLKKLEKLNQEISSITFSGDEVRAVEKSYADIPDDLWKNYDGNWSFAGGEGSQSKCFKFGSACAQSSILSVFQFDKRVIDSLTAGKVDFALNFWNKQKSLCSFTISRSDSPCVNSSVYGPPGTDPNACQDLATPKQQTDCMESKTNYCGAVCPNSTVCEDSACLELQGLLNRGKEGGRIIYEPPPLKNWISGGEPHPVGPKISNGDTYSASYALGWYAITYKPIFYEGEEFDPVADFWEEKAMCVLGISSSGDATCNKDEDLEFTLQFSKSLSNEFGSVISGDIKFIAIGICLVIAYLAIMLSRRDTVHSMMGMSFVAVICVGMSYAACMGAGAYFGIFNTQLNNNIPFLLLGLGVDDAFVLTAEYFRSIKKHPKASVEQHVINACKYGGVSILITSATDALAFLVGCTTLLPALSWFCIFSGVGIVFCFTFQIFIFLPALLINGRRAKSNRYDILCCFKSTKPCCCCPFNGKGKNDARINDSSKEEIEDSASYESTKKKENVSIKLEEEVNGNNNSNYTKNGREIINHEFIAPRGCFCCLGRKNKCLCKPDALSKIMKGFGSGIVTLPGKVIIVLLFMGLLSASILGCTRMYKDFKLEWFIPDGSYLKTFEQWNADYFASGTPMTVYIQDIDYFKEQQKMTQLYQYLNSSKLIDHSEDISFWYNNFIGRMILHPNASSFFNDTSSSLTTVFTNETLFYQQLYEWYRNGQASWNGDDSNIQWKDAHCNNNSSPSCDYDLGIKASKLSATLKLEYIQLGTQRYDTMATLRTGIEEIISKSFPYSFQFLYWEEVGLIDQEFMQNILICGAIIVVIIFLLTPPLVALWVIISVVMSIIGIIGCLHWWGVTISGVSTIYMLISIGLTVDYSAHIAHMFGTSRGTRNERSIMSLTRIGPSVLHAILSTLLAVICIAFSASYVFQVFFKVLCLTVLIGGAHGLVFLPVVLSIGGACNNDKDEEVKMKTKDVELCEVQK